MDSYTSFMCLYVIFVICFLLLCIIVIVTPNPNKGRFKVGDTVFLSTRGYCPAVILEIYSRCDVDMGWDRLLVRTEKGEELVMVARNLKR